MEEIYKEAQEDEAVYKITPKGVAVVSMLRCGLIQNMSDPRFEGFWKMFSDGMEKAGYIQEDEE